jgi:hypothetical protein
MQQPPQMIPMMASFPPTNITTEQIQGVVTFCNSSFILCIYWFMHGFLGGFVSMIY